MSTDNFVVATDTLVTNSLRKVVSGHNNKEAPVTLKWLQTIFVMEDIPFQEIRNKVEPE